MMPTLRSSRRCVGTEGTRARSRSELLVQRSSVGEVLEWLLNSDLARVFDEALLRRRRPIQGLNLSDDLHALEDGPEDHVPPIQVRRRNGGDEELAAVCVLARVRHGQEAPAAMLELEVLVLELRSIDRFAAGAVALCEV